MSISSEVRRAGPYAGNGSTVAFAFSFKVFATSQVRVTRTTSGTEAVLTLTTDYSVSLNANQNTNPGGTVTMVTAPTTAQTVTITSNVANLQPTAIANLGGFYPEVINDSLDRATIQIQQLDERLDRALVIPVSSSGIDTELPAPESSKLIGWDSAGTGLVNYSNIPVGSTTYQYVHRTIATAGQTAFALPITYTVGASALTVYVNGLRVEQGAGLDYLETNNTTITFTSGLAAGDLVVVAIHGDIDAAATPPNYTVESIAALRLLTTATAATQLFLLYNYVAGDGGGTFRYDSTDTTTADNGGTVIVDTAGRRWKRQPLRTYAASSFQNEPSAGLRVFSGSNNNKSITVGYDSTTKLSATGIFRVEESQNAVNGEKITVNGQDIIFKTSSPGTYDVVIGADYIATAAAVAAKINAYPAVFGCSAVHNPTDASTFKRGVVYLTAIAVGAAGNSVTLSRTSSQVLPRIYVSGTRLRGGADVDAAYAQASDAGTAFKNLMLNPNGGNVLIGTAVNDQEAVFLPVLDPTGGYAGTSTKTLATPLFRVDGFTKIFGPLSITDLTIPEGGIEGNYLYSDGLTGTDYFPGLSGTNPLSVFLPISYNETTAHEYTATGTTRSTATQLAQAWTKVDYATAQDQGVRLAVRLGAERSYIVNNTFGRRIRLYPLGTSDRDHFYSQKEGEALYLPAYSAVRNQGMETITQKGYSVYTSMGASYGEIRNLFLRSSFEAAAAGSTVADATVLPWANVFYITSGTGGVRLPPAMPGAQVEIHNTLASDVRVYGSGNDSLGGIASDTGVLVPAGKTTVFKAREWVNRASYTLSNPLSATDTSSTVTVAHTSHGRKIGSLVYFDDTVLLTNNVPVLRLYQVESVPNANSYTIKLAVAAEGNQTSVGGSSVDVSYADGYWQLERRWKAAFRARASADQGSINGSATVTFGTENLDIGSYFASNTWTPPAGQVSMHATVRVKSGHTTGDLAYLTIAKNGSDVVYGQLLEIDNGESISVTYVDTANGADAYTVVFTGSGNPIVIDGTAGVVTYFEGSEI
jgi:hypothetical protein